MDSQLNVQVNSEKLINKKQNFFVGKCCLIAGALFAIIFAVSFIIAKFAFIKMSCNDFETLSIIGSIALIISIVLSFIVSFKGIRASYFLIITSLIVFCGSFIIMFSSYFSLIKNEMMFYALAFTSITLVILGIFGFIISDKVAFSLMKISSIMLVAYLIISIAGSLIINFCWSTNIEIWQIIVTAVIGLVIIISTITSFYSIKKTSEFMNITTIDQTTANKMLLLQSFNLLSSIVMIFMFILRILGIISNRG